MSGRPAISVVIRARDEAASLARCLEVIHGQAIGARGSEVIVVDGGSRDDTVAVAERTGARVVHIDPGEFTYGRALNLGCAQARGDYIVPVSAHAFPPDAGWLARITEPLADLRVACASGDPWAPDGRPLTRRVVQDAALARARPEWGYSNTAGAVRADLWRRRPFRSGLSACEDTEWAWYWLHRGYLCVVDPAFVVDHDHTHDPLADIYRRARLEWTGYGQFLDLPAPRLRHVVRDLWSDVRFYDSPLRARLSHRRAARILGTHAGRRRAWRRHRGGVRRP